MREEIEQVLPTKLMDGVRKLLAERETKSQPDLMGEYMRKARERAGSSDHQADELRRRLVRAEVPAGALDTLATATQTPAIIGAKAWPSTKAVMVLTGDPGSGKTVAAAWAASEFAKAYGWNSQPSGPTREPLVWLDGIGLARIAKFDSTSADLLSAAEDCRMLVVDDAGREALRSAIEALSDVLTARIDHSRRTVLTTNLRGEAFRARYGPALADRFRAKAHIVDVQGLKSMRKP